VWNDKRRGDNATSQTSTNQVSEMIFDCVHGRRRPRRYNGNSSAFAKAAELGEFDSHQNAHNQVS
jgi:hypothetical protein